MLAQQIPGIKFLVVGDGPWRGRFEAEIRARHLEKHFVFTGLVAPERIPALVGIMDVLAHLSRREGLARALPMALAAARPVVACDCDGAGEVCLPDKTGFLVSPGNLREFRDAIMKLWNNAGLRENLGRNGRNLVAASFGRQKMIDDLHALYLRLSQQARLPVQH